jgi:hypothetical protein
MNSAVRKLLIAIGGAAWIAWVGFVVWLFGVMTLKVFNVSDPALLITVAVGLVSFTVMLFLVSLMVFALVFAIGEVNRRVR